MTGDVVLVTGTYLDDPAARLLADAGYEVVYAHDRVSSPELAQLAARHRVRGIIVRQGMIDAEVVTASDRLGVISRHGSGIDRIDVEAAAAAGVPVVRAVGANANSVAEHALGFMFSMIKNLPVLDRSVREGKWLKVGYVGRDVAGSRLGIVGYGAVGQTLAALALPLGMEVGVYDPKLGGIDPAPGISAAPSLNALAARSDVLSLHCPLTPLTRGMVGAPLLDLLPRGAFLINTARGGLVEERALVAALESGRLAGAALDTFETEPLPSDHPLRLRRDVLLSPHVAGAGQRGMRAMAVQSVENLLAVLSGGPVPPAIVALPPAPEGAQKN